MKDLNLQSLLQSNPVFVFQQSAENPYSKSLFQVYSKALASRGIHLPLPTRSFWGVQGEDDTIHHVRPGISGLAYREKNDVNRNYALVCPLKARIQGFWHVSSHLPFSKDELLGFTDALFADFYKMHDFNGLPERFAFSIDGLMNENVHGPSMTATGFLAILDAAHSETRFTGASHAGHPLLSAATAVVQREGDRLRPVAGEHVKVQAFIREFGRGTLLVCASDSCAETFKPWFDHIWKVKSMSEFATRLFETGLLSVFARRRPLSLEDAVNVSARMTRIEVLMDYDRALAIVQRAISCGFSKKLPERWRRHFYEFQNRLLRLTGHTTQSSDRHADFLVYINEAPELLCKEEHLKAVRGYAASLFDCHRFEEGVRILKPLIEEILISPQSYHPNSRTFTWNTYAMLGSVRGILPDWADYNLKALDLQKRWDFTRVHRTLNHMLQSHIRLNELEQAQHILDEMLKAGPMDTSSSVYFTIYHAYYHRARGKKWLMGDPLMEKQKDPFLKARYFQATARMKGISPDESLSRLARAIEELEHNSKQPARGVRIFLLTALRLLYAARKEDRILAEQHVHTLKEFLNLEKYSAFKSFYADSMSALESRPDAEASEYLFRQIPHF